MLGVRGVKKNVFVARASLWKKFYQDFNQGQLLIDIPETIISCLNGNKRTVNVSIIGMIYVVEKREFKSSLGTERVNVIIILSMSNSFCKVCYRTT